MVAQQQQNGDATAAVATATASDDDETPAMVDEHGFALLPSIHIPIKNSSEFIEIFPEELSEISSSTLLQILKEEQVVSLDVWANVGLGYMQQKHLERDSLAILQAACNVMNNNGSSTSTSSTSSSSSSRHHDREARVRILASTGMAHLANGQGQEADQKFTAASKVDTFFPMTWMGKGMYNFGTGSSAGSSNNNNSLAHSRLDQARFFFDTTLKQCGPVLPALLGMAAVSFRERDYKAAQSYYGKAIRYYPDRGGAAIRVGFALACTKLGQVDRAKAAFKRALELDSEYVPAMIGSALLELQSLDVQHSPHYRQQVEQAMKQMSMANVLDSSNAMVQNHLANHYFWKWTPLSGGTTFSVTQGSRFLRASQPTPLDSGERIRIGMQFETVVVEDEASQNNNNNMMDDDPLTFLMKDPWTGESQASIKVWKKDYDRVMALAKGAYNSTKVKEIQAESLFLLARVHHVRQEYENAHRLYDKACMLSPDLSPARFGLAQTLIYQATMMEEEEGGHGGHESGQQQRSSSSSSSSSSSANKIRADAIAHLKLVLGTSPTATDALAALGLLQVKSEMSSSSSSSSSTSFSRQEGLNHLKKALELDPHNADLLVLEAVALQQQRATYSQALEKYQRAVELVLQKETSNNNKSSTLKVSSSQVPMEWYTNIGVLCQETQKYEEALKMYQLALKQLLPQQQKDLSKATLENRGMKGAPIRHAANSMFYEYVILPGYEIVIVAPTTTEGGGGGTDTLTINKTTTTTTNDDDDENAMDVKEDITSILQVGDHVRIGTDFESEVVELVGETTLKIRDTFVVPPPVKPPPLPPTADGGEEQQEDENTQPPPPPPEQQPPPATSFALFVKRENSYLSLPSSSSSTTTAGGATTTTTTPNAAISIAFNIACVHETAGTTLAAIELHKAIVKRVPAYVNSYLRLACMARDCGSLRECSAWLKIACRVAPSNPEVLTLVGNLHLSLCDWSPAQGVFGQLVQQKVASVEAYSNLSLGNIYFANLKAPGKYAKHLEYAAGCYKQVLKKDKDNAYAANGIGTVLAEMGELFKAKDIFHRVREVSGDTIADAHLNLGHVYLAQTKHPEALQMYQSYMKMTQDGRAPITTKSRQEDMAEVLLYIAFAYFDWARLTEQLNNAQAAPADERYRKCIEHLELALSKSKKKDVVIQYNICMTKLQAANCVLQKLSRNIRRTAQEVQDALEGLEESLPKVQEILKWKQEGKKVQITTSMLQDFITHCKANMESAKSHLEEERRREQEAAEIREIQRRTAEHQRKAEELQQAVKAAEEAKKQEERDRKARDRMRKVEELRVGWEQEAQAAALAKDGSGKKRRRKEEAPPLPPEEENTGDLFDEDEDEDDDGNIAPKESSAPAAAASQETSASKIFDDSEDDADDDDDGDAAPPKPTPTEGDLFGESSDEAESDEELVPAGNNKRAKEDGDGDDDDEQASKKRRVEDE